MAEGEKTETRTMPLVKKVGGVAHTSSIEVPIAVIDAARLVHSWMMDNDCVEFMGLRKKP